MERKMDEVSTWVGLEIGVAFGKNVDDEGRVAEKVEVKFEIVEARTFWKLRETVAESGSILPFKPFTYPLTFL
jgi:hypothetical protein